MAERMAIRDFGKSGNFVDFTTTTVTNTSDATLFNNGSFSVAFWVKTTQRIAGRTIVGRRTGATLASRGWLVGPSGSGFVFAEFSDTTNEPGASGFGPKPIADGNWHHVVFVVNRDTDLAYAYVDGVAGGTQLNISALGDIETGATSNFRVGRDGSGNNAFQGKVDELIVWDTVITEAEAMRLYIYGDVPQPDSRRLQWDFNDDALDQSGNGIDGTVSGVTYSTDVPTTPRTTATSRTTATNRVAVRDMGTALRFDGSGDGVSLPAGIRSVVSKSSTEFTLSVWFRPTAVSGTYQIFGSAVDTNDRFSVTISASTLRIGIWNGASWNSGSGGRTVQPGVWSNLTVVSAGGLITAAYLNGILYPPQVGINPISSGTAATFVGIRSDGTTEAFLGIIDEPRIWNRALTATEIKNLYLYGAVPQDGLVAEYLFDEGTGTTALDTSGNGNHGTITGATYTLEVPLEPRASI